MKTTRRNRTKGILIFSVIVLLLATAIAPWLSKNISATFKKGVFTGRWGTVGVIESWEKIDSRDTNFMLLFDALILAGIFWMLFPTKAKLFRANGIKPTRFAPAHAGNNEHGSARFLSTREMDNTCAIWYSGHPLLDNGDIIFGRTDDRRYGEKVWFCNDEKHSIIVGSTGSGKTRRVFLPSIYVIASGAHKDSMVITDTKGEIFLYTKEFLTQQGYNIVYYDFRQPELADQWNPMQAVLDFLKEGDVPAAEQAAVDTATILVEQSTPKDRTSEPFWSESAISIIAGIIMLVAKEAPDRFKNMKTVCDVLGVLGVEVQGGKGQAPIVPLNELMDALPVDHPAAIAYRPARIAPSITRGSMFTSALTNLRLFENTNVAKITAMSTIEMTSIAQRPTAVFLVTPEESSAYNALASIYTAQLFISLTRQAIKNGGKLPRRVNFILDEFGNFPAIPDFCTKLTTGRSRGIKFNIALQGFDQLEKRYGRLDANTIKANCDNLIYLRTAHYETAKYISDRLGDYTIQSDSESVSQQGSLGSRNYSGSTSESTRLQGRKLVTPDELIQWDLNDGAIVLRTGDGGIALFPMPDISVWSANAAFGMGNKIHNQKLLVSRAAQLAVHNSESVQSIDPRKFYKDVMQKYMELSESIEPADDVPVGKKGGSVGANSNGGSSPLPWKGVSR
jgi:type IV secretion system protein VirD4